MRTRTRAETRCDHCNLITAAAEDVVTCDHCGRDVTEEHLHLSRFPREGDAMPEHHYCSWACCLADLPTLPRAGRFHLPTLRWEDAPPGQGAEDFFAALGRALPSPEVAPLSPEAAEFGALLREARWGNAVVTVRDMAEDCRASIYAVEAWEGGRAFMSPEQAARFVVSLGTYHGGEGRPWKADGDEMAAFTRGAWAIEHGTAEERREALDVLRQVVRAMERREQ